MRTTAVPTPLAATTRDHPRGFNLIRARRRFPMDSPLLESRILLTAKAL